MIAGSGHTNGAVNVHFPSQEELALAVVDDLREQWTAAVSLVDDEGAPARELAQRLAAPGGGCPCSNHSLWAIGRLVPDLVAARPDLAPQLQPCCSCGSTSSRRSSGAASEKGPSMVISAPGRSPRRSSPRFSGVEEYSELVTLGADLSSRIGTLMALLDTGMTSTQRRERRSLT